jgi:hypothetical protein
VKQRGAELVAAGLLVLLDEADRGERGEDAVHGPLR